MATPRPYRQRRQYLIDSVGVRGRKQTILPETSQLKLKSFDDESLGRQKRRKISYSSILQL